MLRNLGLLSLLSTSFLLSPVAAVEIWGGSSCATSSQQWRIAGAQANTCYYTSTSITAVIFRDLPSGAKGQVYGGGDSDRCVHYGGETRQSGTCLFGGGIHSANWFYSSKRLVRKESEPLEPTRFGVTYELPDSTKREIEIPNADFDSIFKLVEARDYDALAEFPTYV